MKKVLLIFASFYKKRNLPEKKRIFWEPLGISYLASYLRKYGFIVDILYPLVDEMDEVQITEYLRKKINDYFIIGLSTSDFMTTDIGKYVSIIKELKFTGRIFLGGLGPTCNWREFVRTGVDAVIIGEGEKALLAVTKAVEKDLDYKTIPGLAFIKDKKVYRNGKVELIENLDHNVFPARDISLSFLKKFDINQIHIQIQTSRGCLGNCSFCSIPKFLSEQGGKRYRSRSSESIIEEISLLNQKYGFKKFDFMDENFFPYDEALSVEKAKSLSEKLKCKKINVELFIQCHLQSISLELLTHLHAMNVTSIFVGIDSFQSNELFLFNKEYTRNDVFHFLEIVDSSFYSFDVKSKFRIKTGFINFTPISTMESLFENGLLFRKYNFSCKKLVRNLKVDKWNNFLINRIYTFYPNFSNEKYFKNSNVKMFYDSLMNFYGDYEIIRGDLRNIENAFFNDCSICSFIDIEKVIFYREQLDNLFYDFYFRRLMEIKNSKKYHSNEVLKKLRNLKSEATAIKSKLYKIDDKVNYPINDRGV